MHLRETEGDTGTLTFTSAAAAERIQIDNLKFSFHEERTFKVFISWRENICILWTHTNTPIKSYELISGYKPY